MAKAKQETAEDKADRLERERRAEANSLAHDVAPQGWAGEELAEDSDERKAKIKAREDAAKERRSTRK